jgi:DNA-binding transcriptional LysR family regulator
LVYTKLFDDPFYLVVPIGHPFSRRTAVRAAELRDTPFVGGFKQTTRKSHSISRECAR